MPDKKALCGERGRERDDDEGEGRWYWSVLRGGATLLRTAGVAVIFCCGRARETFSR